jgi:putative membrane protein
MWGLMNDHMGSYGYGWGGWMMFGALHMIAVLLFLALLVWLAVRMARGGGAGSDAGMGAGSGAGGRGTARELLDERYARGEIDRDEYQQRRRDLE